MQNGLLHFSKLKIFLFYFERTNEQKSNIPERDITRWSLLKHLSVCDSVILSSIDGLPCLRHHAFTWADIGKSSVKIKFTLKITAVSPSDPFTNID